MSNRIYLTLLCQYYKFLNATVKIGNDHRLARICLITCLSLMRTQFLFVIYSIKASLAMKMYEGIANAVKFYSYNYFTPIAPHSIKVMVILYIRVSFSRQIEGLVVQG